MEALQGKKKKIHFLCAKRYQSRQRQPNLGQLCEVQQVGSSKGKMRVCITCTLSILPQLETKGLNTSSFQPRFRATFQFKKKKGKKGKEKEVFHTFKVFMEFKTVRCCPRSRPVLAEKGLLRCAPAGAGQSGLLGAPLAHMDEAS